jgi:hypothetical protein
MRIDVQWMLMSTLVNTGDAVVQESRGIKHTLLGQFVAARLAM